MAKARIAEEIDKRDVERLRAQETAEKMKSMLAVYRQAVEREILENISNMPIVDLQEKQAQYKATLHLLRWLDCEIAKGKKVSSRLDKEDK